MNDNNNFEIRSKEVKDIIGKTPPFILRVGMLAILISILTLLFVSYFINYSEIIEFDIIIKPVENNDNNFEGDILVPVNQIFKIQKKQDVLISFEQIQDNDFSFIKTKIKTINDSILSINNEKFYIAKTELFQITNNYFKTDFKLKKLEIKCEIELEKKPLLLKFINLGK